MGLNAARKEFSDAWTRRVTHPRPFPGLVSRFPEQLRRRDHCNFRAAKNTISRAEPGLVILPPSNHTFLFQHILCITMQQTAFSFRI